MSSTFFRTVNNFQLLRVIIQNRKFATMADVGTTDGTKRVCRRIGTHNGTFHCDEALACFLLRQLPEYKDAEIVRTRDERVLDTCDIVVDVGGVFDPSRHRYDHHQRSFAHSMHSLDQRMPWVTKLSSAGLVYHHFGVDVLKTIGALAGADKEKVGAIFDKVYENFMEEIDAIDNGIAPHDEKPRYSITTNLSSRVKNLNADWTDTNSDEEGGFRKAMALTGAEFLDKVNYYSRSWWPARELVESALNGRFEVDTSGEVIVLENGGFPWKEHLYALEQAMKIEPCIKYVLYTDQNGKWRVQCVPVASTSFTNRLSLPEKWCGVRNEALSELSGIPGCIFVHANGFIGGNETYEGACRMVKASLAGVKSD